MGFVILCVKQTGQFNTKNYKSHRSTSMESLCGAIAFHTPMPSANNVVSVGDILTIQDVVHVARQNYHVALSESAREKIAASRAWVEKIVERGQPITYGINTGFGVFANVHVSAQQA